jgi:hypothetical protein
MSTYALSMDCPHATTPAVLWRVMVFDDVAKTGAEMPGHTLWAPELDTWTLDTLRMVLHELAAYLPAHDTATVTIKARTSRAPGRARKDGTPRPPIFKHEAISVSARGWTAMVWTWRNEVTDKDGKYLGRGPGEWSEPMQAVLLDLAAKSPFPLDPVRIVACADPYDSQLRYPARRDVVRGIERDPTHAASAARQRLQQLLDRVQDLIDDVDETLGGAQ